MIAMVPNREALQAPRAPPRPVARRVRRSAGGSRRSRRPGSSREFLGLRQYEVGDDVRDLDWGGHAQVRPAAFLRLYRQEVGSRCCS